MPVFVDDSRLYGEIVIKGPMPDGTICKRKYRGVWSLMTVTTMGEWAVFLNLIKTDAQRLRSSGILKANRMLGVRAIYERAPPRAPLMKVTDRARRHAISIGAIPVAFGTPEWLRVFGGLTDGVARTDFRRAMDKLTAAVTVRPATKKASFVPYADGRKDAGVKTVTDVVKWTISFAPGSVGEALNEADALAKLSAQFAVKAGV